MEEARMEAQAAAQQGLITRAQVMSFGLTGKAIEYRLASRHLRGVRRGVYSLPGALDTPRRRALAAVFAAGEGARLSCTSAAALHGLPGFEIEPLTVCVTRNGRRSLTGVRLEQSLALPTHHTMVIDGIPCTTPARTLFDLCGDVHPRRAERALDTALARKLVALPALWRVLDDLAEHGRVGTVLMRALLTAREPSYVAPESELEARFIELTRVNGLVEPERQVDLGDDEGWIGRVDFLFRGAKIVVEVDGAEFHDALVDRRRDEARDARLVAAGWFVLRLRWADVAKRPAAVAHSIRFRCALPPL